MILRVSIITKVKDSSPSPAADIVGVHGQVLSLLCSVSIRLRGMEK